MMSTISRWTNPEEMMSMLSQWRTESEEIKPNINIPLESIDLEFNKNIKVLIERIEANPIGRRLLEKIRLCTSQIFIRYGDDDLCISISGAKLPVVVIFSMKDSVCFSTKGESIPLQKHVILFHELTHAYHYLSGKKVTSHLSDPLVWETDEEYKTVMGCPSKKGKTKAKITENAFRKAENLPERFGSWDPSKFEGLTILSVARIKLLGRIHVHNQSISLLNSSPPPIALCSISDLGIPNFCLLMSTIKGVNVDFTPNNKAIITIFKKLSSIDSMMGNRCYLSLSSEIELTSEKIINSYHELYPKLKGVDFEIKSMSWLRVSQMELNIILDNSRADLG